MIVTAVPGATAPLGNVDVVELLLQDPLPLTHSACCDVREIVHDGPRGFAILHEAVVPPPLPTQLHMVFEPLTDDDVGEPCAQTPEVALHTPLIGSAMLHEAVVPPPLPAQVHVVLVPLSNVDVGVPMEQAPAGVLHMPLIAATPQLVL